MSEESMLAANLKRQLSRFSGIISKRFNKAKHKLLVERIFLISKRLFGIPSFFNYAIADGIFNLIFPDKTALRGIRPNTIDDFQLRFQFG